MRQPLGLGFGTLLFQFYSLNDGLLNLLHHFK